jgi:type I restriction enzyme S subunit
MKHWPTKLLGELCDVEGGNAAPQGDQNFKGGTIPFVRMKDLGRYHFTNSLTKTDDKLTEASAIANRMKFFEPGCILFPRSGSVALNHRAILGIRACIVSHIGILQNLRSEISPGFLYLYLTTFDMTALSKKTTGVDSIAFADVKKIPVPVPPLAEQERIVKLLDEADALRELRAQADQRTASLMPALFHDIFGDPLANLHGWQTKELRQLGRVVTGSTPPSVKEGMFGGDIPFITPGDLEKNTHETMRYVTESGAAEVRTIRAGSTMVCCIGATIGKTDRTWKTSAFNQQINAVEWSDEIEDDFGVVCMKQCTKVVIQQGSQTALPILKKSLFEKIRIPVPPLSLQKEFAQRVAEIRELEAGQATSRTRLDALFQSMLHRAFNGEL